MAWQETDEGIGSIQFTAAMTGLYIVVFVAEIANKNLAPLQSFAWRLGNGEIWRLVTSTTLHGGFLHIIFNALWFFRLNQALERWLGPWLAMLAYIYFAIGAGAAEALFVPGTAIGASGVVYGIFGFLWVCRRRYDIAAEVVTPAVIQTMLIWLGICFVINQMGGNIANTAHIFGLVFGWLLGQIVVARRKHFWPILAGTGLLWVALGLMTWLPVWERTLAHVPWVKGRYAYVTMPRETWPVREERLGGIKPGM